MLEKLNEGTVAAHLQELSEEQVTVNSEVVFYLGSQRAS